MDNRYKIIFGMLRVVRKEVGKQRLYYMSLLEILEEASKHFDLSWVAFALRGNDGLRIYNIARSNLFKMGKDND